MNAGGRGKVNAAEMATAHRFAKGARNLERSNRNDLRTPFASNEEVTSMAVGGGQQSVNRWNAEDYRSLRTELGNAPERTVAQMGTQQAFASQEQGGRDPSIAVTGVDDGLADMATGNKEDQYFDNVAWYSSVYKDALGHKDDLGKVILDDRFFGWLEKKKEQEWFKQYQLWKLSLVDLSSPPVRDWWQKQFPELVQKKLLFYRNREQVRAKLNEIKIRGPDGRADLEFLYLYNLGMFDSSDMNDVNEYLMNPQNKKIWLAAMQEGKISWDKIDWNLDQKQPPSTPLDSLREMAGNYPPRAL